MPNKTSQTKALQKKSYQVSTKTKQRSTKTEIMSEQSKQLRRDGKMMIDYICNYWNTLNERRVVPNVTPGYLPPLLPKEAPPKPENFKDVLKDVENFIMPGITHWQHKRFHAYFPAANSVPSIIGDMLSGAIGCIGFSWVASPACAELEIVVVDWIARMMNLPKEFCHSENLGGGGVIQGSASDCVLVTMLAARHRALSIQKSKSEKIEDLNILDSLVGYCSCLAHSCVEKSGMISFVKIRMLEVDEEFSLRGEVLEEAIKRDIANGLIPFYVVCTLGTTACCSFDNLEEITQVCKKYDIWLHVDAAYAGSSFICPEFRFINKGIEKVDSINFNPNKFMLINFDCSVLWVRNHLAITESMIVDPVYLQHKHSDLAVDFRHWGIPLSRRFRSLKIWFTLRAYGVEGLQKYIRNHVNLAKEFETLVRSDPRFEIVGKVVLGLVCFRLKQHNSINQCLMRSINESGLIHMTPSVVKDKYILRFCVCSEFAISEDIVYAWMTITKFADEILLAKNGIYQWKNFNESNNFTKRLFTTAEHLVNSVLLPYSVKRFSSDMSESDEFEDLLSPEILSDSKLKENDENINQNNNLLDDEYDYDDDDEEEEDSDNGETSQLLSNELENVSINDKCTSNRNSLDKPTFINGASNESVFVCENDLGIGVCKESSLTTLRRQKLLKMISDPSVYRKRFFKNLCFCHDRRNSVTKRRQMKPKKLVAPDQRCNNEINCNKEHDINSLVQKGSLENLNKYSRFSSKSSSEC